MELQLIPILVHFLSALICEDRRHRKKVTSFIDFLYTVPLYFPGNIGVVEIVSNRNK